VGLLNHDSNNPPIIISFAMASGTVEPHIVILGEVSMDLARREARVGNRPLRLTAKEFDLLAFLIRHRGIAFSRDRLLQQVWEYGRPVDTRTVDSHVRSLRAKLGEAAGIVKTLRGVGYRAET
jgi:DNA-binding response OmpR family regulator